MGRQSGDLVAQIVESVLLVASLVVLFVVRLVVDLAGGRPVFWCGRAVDLSGDKPVFRYRIVGMVSNVRDIGNCECGETRRNPLICNNGNNLQ